MIGLQVVLNTMYVVIVTMWDSNVIAWYGLRYDNKWEWLQDVEVWEMGIGWKGGRWYILYKI